MKQLIYVLLMILSVSLVGAVSPVGNITLPTDVNVTNVTIIIDNPLFLKYYNISSENINLSIDGRNISTNLTLFHNGDISDFGAIGNFQGLMPAFNITPLNWQFPEMFLEGIFGYYNKYCGFTDVKITINESKQAINKTTLMVIPCLIDSTGININTTTTIEHSVNITSEIFNSSLNKTVNYTYQENYTEVINNIKYLPIIIELQVDNSTYTLENLSWDFENFSITLPLKNGTHYFQLRNIGYSQKWNFTLINNLTNNTPIVSPDPPIEEDKEETPSTRRKGGSGASFYFRDNYTLNDTIEEPIEEIVEEEPLPFIPSPPVLSPIMEEITGNTVGVSNSAKIIKWFALGALSLIILIISLFFWLAGRNEDEVKNE